MLDASVNLTFDSRRFYMLLDLCYNVPYKCLSRILAECYLLCELVIYLRLKIFKR